MDEWQLWGSCNAAPEAITKVRFGEGFLMRVAAKRCALARPRPALENLPMGKLRGSWICLWGKCVVGWATVASGVRLKVRMVPDTFAHSAEDADEAVFFGVIAASWDAGNEQTHALRARSADCSWWFSVTDDRRYVMRPAPSVVRATSVFARAERSRRCALGRRSRGKVRAG